MVRAAAAAGCDYAKVQSFSLARLNPADNQAEWLRQAHLDREDHERVMAACQEAGIAFLSTPFDADSLQMLRELGQTTFKIASSESGNNWWMPAETGRRLIERWLISYPWGDAPLITGSAHWMTRLTAIPLYPCPLEAVGRAPMLDGYSDHTVGLTACQWAIANGVKVVEAHMALPDRGRRNTWDKLPEQMRQLREFSDEVLTMTSGVATRFRKRWN
jgi:sialic acid synthase SpsE